MVVLSASIGGLTNRDSAWRHLSKHSQARKKIVPAPTVAFGLFDTIFIYLAQHGVPEQALCDRLGIKSKQEGVLFGRVPLTLYEQAFVAAEQLTGDVCVGLNMGRTALPSTYGVFYFLSIAGETLHQVLATITRFFPLMYDFITPVMSNNEHTLRMEFHYTFGRRPHRHVIEHLYSTWFTTARLLGYDEKHVPRTLSLMHACPIDDRLMQQVFPDTPVSFGQPHDSFELQVNCLAYRPTQVDHHRFELSEKQAAEQMLRLRSRDRIAQEISGHVESLLPEGLPTLEQVAERMKCSGRTLQRRLSERHLNYQMLLDHIRRELAIQLLTTTELPMTQIATRIGFTNDSTFHRAFKRWTGELPGHYRARPGH